MISGKVTVPETTLAERSRSQNPARTLLRLRSGDGYQAKDVTGASSRPRWGWCQHQQSPSGRPSSPVYAPHNGKRTVTVRAKKASPIVGQICSQLEPKLENLQQNWPTGYTYAVGGETESQAETFGSAVQALALAIFLVFAVLLL